MTKKNISFKLDNELHKQIKIKATENDKTIKDYLINLAENDIKGIDPEYQKQIENYERIKKEAIESLEKAEKIEGIQEYNLELWRDLIKECDKSIENVKEWDRTWKNVK